jgi:SAM-dependent methyltransferase
MKLNSDQVVFHPLSGFDPSGRVFWWEGNLYRAISNEQAAFYKHLLTEGIVRHLVERELIIDTQETKLEFDGYGLVLKHQIVPFVSYCCEWCGDMLKVAALHILRLERELLKYGLTLTDPHPRNVLFVGPTPLWVDLGSLSPVCRGQPWLAHDQYSAHFTRPLQIMAAGHPRIARCLLRDGHFWGVEQREVEAITGTVSPDITQIARARIKSIAKRVIPQTLQPVARRVVQHWRRPACGEAEQEPMSGVEKAICEIENIHLIQPATEWSSYDSIGFPDFVSTAGWTEKHRSILQILLSKKPHSVLDIGSNRGWYSQLAARNGAQVVSVDFDEPSVAKLFADSAKGCLPILPLVMDFDNLSPAMAWNGSSELAAAKRLRCDMVFALALVHHLVFTQYMNFERIVIGLSAVALKWLVVEFIGSGDQYVKEWMNNYHDWYSLETFLTALSREFKSIIQFPSDSEHRHVLLCQR